MGQVSTLGQQHRVWIFYSKCSILRNGFGPAYDTLEEKHFANRYVVWTDSPCKNITSLATTLLATDVIRLCTYINKIIYTTCTLVLIKKPLRKHSRSDRLGVILWKIGWIHKGGQLIDDHEFFQRFLNFQPRHAINFCLTQRARGGKEQTVHFISNVSDVYRKQFICLTSSIDFSIIKLAANFSQKKADMWGGRGGGRGWRNNRREGGGERWGDRSPHPSPSLSCCHILLLNIHLNCCVLHYVTIYSLEGDSAGALIAPDKHRRRIVCCRSSQQIAKTVRIESLHKIHLHHPRRFPPNTQNAINRKLSHIWVYQMQIFIKM